VKDPKRTLPRAIVLGVLGVVVVYLLANLAFVSVLGIDGLAGDRYFAARIMREALGARGERVLAAAMAVSALGWCLVCIVTSPWLYVAMAKERLFFRSFGVLHPRRGVPTLALLAQAAVMLVYVFAGDLNYLVDAVVFVEWIFHGLVAYALIWLRSRRPELARPYRSPLFPLAPVVYLAAALVVVGNTLWTQDMELKALGLGVTLAGALVYVAWRRLGAARVAA
jgi:basic amino acid/polyamine antiporter, APA family